MTVVGRASAWISADTDIYDIVVDIVLCTLVFTPVPTITYVVLHLVGAGEGHAKGCFNMCLMALPMAGAS